METKEALRVYYRSHPEWEQRRFELVKGFAISQHHAVVKKDNFHCIDDIDVMVRLADEVLGSINEEIAEILNSK